MRQFILNVLFVMIILSIIDTAGIEPPMWQYWVVVFSIAAIGANNIID